MIQGEIHNRNHMIFLSTIKICLTDYDTDHEISKGNLTSRKWSIKVLKNRFQSRYVWPLTCDKKCLSLHVFLFMVISLHN